MRVLHIYKDYYPVIGGIENYIKTLAEYQAGHGHDVTVLVTSPNGRSSDELVNSVRVIKASRIATVSSTPLSFSIFRLVSRLEADVTHLHFPYPLGEIASYLFGKSKRTVITYHSDVIKQKFILPFVSPLLRRVLFRADRIIATSPRYIDTSPFLSRVREKCVVVPLGIDMSRFRLPNTEAIQKIRSQYKSSRIVLFVGRLRYFKGLSYLIDAMKYVNGHLLIVGTGPEGNSLKERVLNGSISNISFLEDIPDNLLPAYYHAADLFVLPSSHRSEAFGTVLLEAMASGTPVISTELGTGTSYVNLHGKTGLVVPPRDAVALTDAINKLLNNENLRVKLSRNALKRAHHFSDEALNNKIVELYTSCL